MCVNYYKWKLLESCLFIWVSVKIYIKTFQWLANAVRKKCQIFFCDYRGSKILSLLLWLHFQHSPHSPISSLCKYISFFLGLQFLKLCFSQELRFFCSMYLEFSWENSMEWLPFLHLNHFLYGSTILECFLDQL